MMGKSEWTMSRLYHKCPNSFLLLLLLLLPFTGENINETAGESKEACVLHRYSVRLAQ